MKKNGFAPLIIILVVVVLGIAAALLVSLHQVLNFSPSGNITANVSLGSGNFIVSKSPDTNISGNISYKLLNKPSTSFKDNKLQISGKSFGGILGLPTGKPLVLSAITGAGDLSINLRDLTIETALINTGAGNINLSAPADSSSKIDVALGAGNLILDIPTKGKLDGVKIVTTTNLDKGLGSSWVKVTDGYETQGFDDTKIVSIINLTMGAGNLIINTVD